MGYIASSSSAASPTSTITRCCMLSSTRGRGSVEGEVLRLHELEQPVVAALAPDAALLHAAERRRRVRDDAAVEPDHAGLDRLADRHGAPQVAAVDVRD